MIRSLVIVALSATVLSSCISDQGELPTLISTLPPTEYPTQSSTLNYPTLEPLPIGDGGLLTGRPCASPCFYGIRIGETHPDQVVSELGKNGISSCTQNVDSISCGFGIFIRVNSPDPLIDSIGYSPTVSVSLEDVIEKYGDPDLIQAFPGDDIPEYSKIWILLFWDSIRMTIQLPEIDGETYAIEKITSVEWITFLDETEYTYLREDPLSQPWRGYGIYQLDPSQ